MLTLKFNKEPFWVELIEGLRWKVRPFSTVILEQARDRIADAGGESAGMRENIALLTKEIAKLVVFEWEGVIEPDGAPVPVSEDSIEAAMMFPLVSHMFYTAYVADGLRMGFEKKGFAPLPNGISEGAQDIAADVSQPLASDAAPQTATPAPIQ